MAMTTIEQTSLPRVSSYWERSQWPLQALYFLLPLLLVYEVGTFLCAPAGQTRLSPIVAESLLGRFFHLFGITGFYLPGLVVVVLLLSLHMARRTPRGSWAPEPRLYLAMAFEALALALPLFVLMLVLFRAPAVPKAVQAAAAQPVSIVTTLAAGQRPADGRTGPSAGRCPAAIGVPLLARDTSDNPQAAPLSARLLWSIGAGIYEELVFRVIAIAVLHGLFVDVLDMKKSHGAMLAIAISALAFAFYHFPEPNPLHWHAFWAGFDGLRFVFFTAAGVYFAAIYVLRGFGIVAGVHACYDLLVNLVPLVLVIRH